MLCAALYIHTPRRMGHWNSGRKIQYCASIHACEYSLFVHVIACADINLISLGYDSLVHVFIGAKHVVRLSE